MPVDLIRVVSDVILSLNAGTPGTYGVTVTDPRWNASQISDAVLTADALVVAAILRNKSNSRNQLYYATQFGLANGGTIGINIAGEVAAVTFTVTAATEPINNGARSGDEWPKVEIDNENRYPVLGYDPHYFIDGNVIYHNGSALASYYGAGVSVDVTFPFFVRVSTCQSPDEYEYAVYCGAMSLLQPVEGENVDSASTWAGQFQQLLKMIEMGSGDVPLGATGSGQ